ITHNTINAQKNRTFHAGTTPEITHPFANSATYSSTTISYRTQKSVWDNFVANIFKYLKTPNLHRQRMVPSDDMGSVSLDDQILAQQREIENEVAASQPLIGNKESLDRLVKEYSQDTASRFYEKAVQLQNKYTFLRRVRGDGNCFYRAVAFNLCEKLLQNPENVDYYLALLDAWQTCMEKLGYQNLTITEFFETFADLLTSIKNGMTEEQLLARFNDQYMSDYSVVFMRLITAGYMLENVILFEGFIEGGRTVREFCSSEVEPMGRECEHVSIMALVNALDISLRIEYLDQSQAIGNNQMHHSVNDNNNDKMEMYFLYRPGHYDILYC
ncbi:Ubiquitin thioesterase OTUB1, partial [Trichinella britovi]